MNWVDFLILGIIALSSIISLVRGFVREALSLLTWIVAFWVGWIFFRDLAAQLEPWISLPSLRLAIAFGILLIATLLVGGLINFLVSQLVDKTGLSGTDRMIGAIFGIARGGVLDAILVLLAGLTTIPTTDWWRDSMLISYSQDLAIWLRSFLSSDIADKFRYL